ncbi:DUF6333 family protein [Streptomyces sp. NPDC057743]|uniref:DUF6333 family protein n=1 Tax=Streptomyces sp. NPDC057743 TaxID=3346236 RepID=UPI0036CA24F8
MSLVSPETQVDPRHSGHAHLVIIHPPFGAPLLPHERPPATAHDPGAARAAVLSLSTVSAIRHECTPSRLAHPPSPASREELDGVRASVWGSTVKISDPALVEDGVLAGALEDEFQAQKDRHPNAWIVAVCERDFGASYTKVLVAAPSTPVTPDAPHAPDLTIEGFGEWEVTGDPRATLAAAGIAPDVLSGASDADGDEAVDHDALLHMLTGGALSVYADEERFESTFLVERSEEGEDTIREVWFP